MAHNTVWHMAWYMAWLIHPPTGHPSMQGEGRICPPLPTLRAHQVFGTQELSQPCHLHQRSSPGHLMERRARRYQARIETTQGQQPPVGAGGEVAKPGSLTPRTPFSAREENICLGSGRALASWAGVAGRVKPYPIPSVCCLLLSLPPSSTTSKTQQPLEGELEAARQQFPSASYLICPSPE